MCLGNIHFINCMGITIDPAVPAVDTTLRAQYATAEGDILCTFVGELSGNTDTYWSVYMSKERGSDQFKTGPVWDFDIAFDNDYRTYPLNNKSEFVCFSGGVGLLILGLCVMRKK